MTDNQLLQGIASRVALMDQKIDGLKKEMKKGFEEVNDRLDRQGKSLACLELRS